MVDMEEDYMEDYQMEEGEDTDEFEDIENEDENDPDDLFERTLEVDIFANILYIRGLFFSLHVILWCPILAMIGGFSLFSQLIFQ